MELSTSSISNEIDKSIQEEFSVSEAAIDEIKRRREKGQKPESISNEEIRKGDPVLDTYKVLDDAVHGGMGSVWRVHHESWNVDLAMKRPQPRFFAEGSEARKEEFIRECENWINLGLHPNIVSCYYVREIGGVPTIFSEWMDNGSLKDRIRDGSLYAGTEEEVQERILDIAIQTARGLQYSHENGLIHQDVKPGNILLTKGWDAKVADFGLAKAQSQLMENEKPVSTGYTIQYCPKEQAEGKPAEKWMDVYAWALTVLEMYAGKRLWETGAEAKENCEEYFKQCRALPSGMKELIDSCLAGEMDDFSRLETLLKEEYRKICGKEYPKPDSKAAFDTADSLNNRALSFLDLKKTDQATKLWEQAAEKDTSNGVVAANKALHLWNIGELTDESVLEILLKEYKRTENEIIKKNLFAFAAGTNHILDASGELFQFIKAESSLPTPTYIDRRLVLENVLIQAAVFINSALVLLGGKGFLCVKNMEENGRKSERYLTQEDLENYSGMSPSICTFEHFYRDNENHCGATEQSINVSVLRRSAICLRFQYLQSAQHIGKPGSMDQISAKQ